MHTVPARIEFAIGVGGVQTITVTSPLPIIGKGLTESALRARKHRPMLMLDLAVPRDIEGEVGRLDDVFLYTVDDLGRIAREGMVVMSSVDSPYFDLTNKFIDASPVAKRTEAMLTRRWLGFESEPRRFIFAIIPPR